MPNKGKGRGRHAKKNGGGNNQAGAAQPTLKSVAHDKKELANHVFHNKGDKQIDHFTKTSEFPFHCAMNNCECGHDLAEALKSGTELNWASVHSARPTPVGDNGNPRALTEAEEESWKLA